MTETTVPRSRTICMQLSTNVYRWPDDLLGKCFPDHLHELDEVRAELRDMEAGGMVVFPCNRHRCDETTGRCTGEPE